MRFLYYSQRKTFLECLFLLNLRRIAAPDCDNFTLMACKVSNAVSRGVSRLARDIVWVLLESITESHGSRLLYKTLSSQSLHALTFASTTII